MEFKDARENLVKVILDSSITFSGKVLTGREHIGLQDSLRTVLALAEEALANREAKKEKIEESEKKEN